MIDPAALLRRLAAQTQANRYAQIVRTATAKAVERVVRK